MTSFVFELNNMCVMCVQLYIKIKKPLVMEITKVPKHDHLKQFPKNKPLIRAIYTSMSYLRRKQLV